MDDPNLITKLPDEGYSPEAIANLDGAVEEFAESLLVICLLYTSPSPRD